MACQNTNGAVRCHARASSPMMCGMYSFHVHLAAVENTAASMSSFDAALAALALLPRLFIEPDGSFVWTGDENGQPWQVDGNLIDRGDCLAYVELKGNCPEQQFDRLLAACGWPASPLAFQLPRRGVTLDEAEFRSLAATEAGAM
jgi:hypothetical protein